MKYKIEIPIRPMPKQSVRFNKKTGHTYQPPSVVKYVETLRAAISEVWEYKVTDLPLSIEVEFSFRTPKSFPGWRRTLIDGEPEPRPVRPDIDNLTKPLLDAMSGIIYEDDAQVYHLSAKKQTATNDGISIVIAVGSTYKRD